MAAHEHRGHANGRWKNWMILLNMQTNANPEDVKTRYEENEDTNPRTMTQNMSIPYLPDYHNRH